MKTSVLSPHIFDAADVPGKCFQDFKASGPMSVFTWVFVLIAVAQMLGEQLLTLYFVPQNNFTVSFAENTLTPKLSFLLFCFLCENMSQRKDTKKPTNTTASNASQPKKCYKKQVFYFQMVVTHTFMSINSQNVTMPSKHTRLSESNHSWGHIFKTILSPFIF